MKFKYVELYTVKSYEVYNLLKNGQKYKVKVNKYKENHNDMEDVYKTIASYLKNGIFDSVQRPIYTYVVTRKSGVESHLKDRDFRTFRFDEEKNVILHLRVPFKECLIYEYNNHDYFNDVNMIKKCKIKNFDDLDTMEDLDIQCCLAIIKPEWLVKMYSFDDIKKLI